MIFCGNCGAQAQAGTRFCGSCGSPMAPAPSSAPTSSSPPSAGESSDQLTQAAPASTDASASASASASGPSRVGAGPAGASPAGSSADDSGAYDASAYDSAAYDPRAYEAAAYGSAAPASHASASAGAAPWATGSSGAQADAAGPREPKRRKPLPLMPLAAAGAALAIVVGAGSAYLMMRGSDDAPGTQLDTQLLGQQGDAPTKAPGKIWSRSNDDIVRGAGLDPTSSNTAGLLSYGTNGMLLMSVPTTAVVALKEGDGSVAWQVKGSFETCQPLVDKGGWACVYSPPAQDGSSSSSNSSQPSRQLVTLDGNGRLNKVKDLSSDESLLQERTGTLWVASGLDSANEDQAAGSSETRSVALTRLDDAGKALWTFSRNLTMTSPSLNAGGEAGRPLFTSDGVTYLRGAADSNGKGVAIDASGKVTDKLASPAIANDQGRPITQKGSDFYDGGEKMKTPISNLMTPTMADTGTLPLYDTSDGKIRKLKSRGSGVEWDVAASDASPVAYCGSTTVTTTSDNKVWYFDGKGKDIGSGQLNGSPQFCWGGKQLVSYDSSSTAVIGHDLASGQDVWRFNLKDDPSTAQMNGITYSPTSDGFVATGDGVVYYGPTK